MFEIFLSVEVKEDLADLRAHDRKILLNAIEVQLAHQPDVPTRNRKILRKLIPPWEGVDPIWQLKVGEYRVFYDVDREARRVYVRAVREKPPHTTTEEIL